MNTATQLTHFDSGLNDDMRDVRNKSIANRHNELHNLMIASDDTALNYLFITNGGGLVLMLACIGMLFGIDSTPLLSKAALGVFFAGVLFVGLYKAYTLTYYEEVFEHYQGLINQYYQGEISWEEVRKSDREKEGDSMIPYVLGYGAFFCLIGGGICGVMAII